MPPPRETFGVDHDDWLVQVTDDTSRTLILKAADAAYHSGSGAVAETRCVYLGNSGIADRLASKVPSSVLEIGLGTGMGMLLTVDAALATSTSLRYSAIESQWPTADVLSQLKLEAHVEDSSLVSRYLHWRQTLGDPVPSGGYRWQAGPAQSLTVYHVDALAWDADEGSRYDAIYFDPFAPDTNPELWKPAFLSRMFQLLDTHGRLVTYCVSRSVRESFATAGFQTERVRGPKGGKREVMIATKASRGSNQAV